MPSFLRDGNDWCFITYLCFIINIWSKISEKGIQTCLKKKTNLIKRLSSTPFNVLNANKVIFLKDIHAFSFNDSLNAKLAIVRFTKNQIIL